MYTRKVNLCYTGFALERMSEAERYGICGMTLLFFVICFLASVIGAVCGIGGGILIKPILDAFGVLDVAAISFLSGCTVLAMSACSVIKNKWSGASRIEQKIGFPLALGSAAGGIAGKYLFSLVSSLAPEKDRVGAVQAACLVVVTAGTMIYTILKEKIPSYRMSRPAVCVLTGCFLGILSSFLGIGGGPINLVVLFFFFSMNTKTAAEYSLYIILFSQLASLLSAIVTKSVPPFPPLLLAVMAGGGICGAVAGRRINDKISEHTVDTLFLWLMLAIILINIYNIFKFLA